MDRNTIDGICFQRKRKLLRGLVMGYWMADAVDGGERRENAKIIEFRAEEKLVTTRAYTLHCSVGSTG